MLRKLAFIFLGYLVAVFVASAVTMAIISLSMAPGQQPEGVASSFLSDMFVGFLVGSVWTFACAWPGFIAAVLLGERSRWSGWPIYATAGLANVLPSLAIFAGAGGSPGDMPWMVAGALPGGFAGGVAYWAAIGRIIARQRGGERP